MRLLKGSARRFATVLASGAALAVGWLGAPVAGAQDAFVVRPYLMDPRPRSMAVLFELGAPSAATVTARTDDGRVAARAQGRPATFHELVLGGLSPATAYRYRVETGGGGAAEGRFTTAPASGDGPTRVIVYGDSRSDAAAHLTVARAIAAEAAELVVHTGDMVEDGEVVAQWHEALGTLAPAIRDVPFLPVLGNHELVLPFGAGLPTWRKYVRAPHGGPEGETSYVVHHGPLSIVVLDVYSDLREGTPARRWLEQTLRGARARRGVRHVMVAVHHGPLSSGHHGENAVLDHAGIPELLRRAGVSLVVSGHDHAYERGEQRGLKYIVSGGGGAPLYQVNRREPYQLAFEAAYHYVVVEVSGDRLDVTAKRADGSVIDRCAFVGRGSWRCPGATNGRGTITGTEAALLGDDGAWMTVAGVAVVLIGGAALLVRRRRERSRTGGGRA